MRGSSRTGISALAGPADDDVLAATQIILAAHTRRDLLDLLSGIQKSLDIIGERLATLAAGKLVLTWLGWHGPVPLSSGRLHRHRHRGDVAR